MVYQYFFNVHLVTIAADIKDMHFNVSYFLNHYHHDIINS